MDNMSFCRNIFDNLEEGVYITDRNMNIVYWNDGAKQITGYSKDDIRSDPHCCKSLVHIDSEGKSLCSTNCPMRVTLNEGTMHKTKLFLRHKQGHRVPVNLTVVPVTNEKNEVVGAVEIFSDISVRIAIENKIKELSRLALIDPLITLGNRRYIEMNLKSRLDEFKRYGNNFGMLFIDIDDFKSINDKYGHDIGDKVLQMSAKTLLGNKRSFDIAGRWGGEEFILLIMNTNNDHLYAISEKMRMLIASSSFEHGNNKIGVTISIGATLCIPQDDIESIVRRSDQLMYKSKTLGKNKTSMDLYGAFNI